MYAASLEQREETAAAKKRVEVDQAQVKEMRQACLETNVQTKTRASNGKCLFHLNVLHAYHKSLIVLVTVLPP